MSSDFPEALELAGRIRDEIVPYAKLVLITNGTGLLDKRLFSLLQDAASGPLTLDIWLKLDAGTAEWYEKMNRSNLPFEELITKIREFAASSPLTIQTMFCTVDNKPPPPLEEEAWEKLLVNLAETAKAQAAKDETVFIRKVQIYGKARPAPEDPKAGAQPVEYLNERRDKLLKKFYALNITAPPVVVYP